jgi:hypothetical protein
MFETLTIWMTLHSYKLTETDQQCTQKVEERMHIHQNLIRKNIVCFTWNTNQLRRVVS